MRIVRIGCLAVVFLLMVFSVNFGVLQAAQVIKTTAGQAVLVEGAEKARSEAVLDALGEALNRYIYDDMAVSREFERQINDKILKRRKFYVKSYGIQSERTLGDLYQVELRVELQSDLLEQELKKIEKGERRQVEQLTLVVLPPAESGHKGIDPNSSNRNYPHLENNGAQALEPTSLLQSLSEELAVYGFSLEMINPTSPDLLEMFAQLLKTNQAESRQMPKASWFQGLLPGDLIVVVRSSKVREEIIVSLRKSFWQAQADILFIDTKNEMVTHLPRVTAKIINSDYIAGMEQLTKKLTKQVQQSSLDRLLRDYIVPQESEELVVLQCQGFHNPADFAVFKESLQSLRTVKEVTLQALAPGCLELGVRILTSAPLLVKWLNSYRSENTSFTLQVFPLGEGLGRSRQSPVISQQSMVALGDEIPEHFLVRVNYAPETGN